MLSFLRYSVICAILVCLPNLSSAQTEELHGQASGWVTANPQDQPASLFGLRYIPDLLAGQPLGGQFNADLELSFNTFATASFAKDQSASYDARLKLYRGWFRLSTDRWEIRAGLQKINFGSALLFRPLMWFDRIDPRDPLQLTDGVYGVLTRYYFQDNANIWLWGLYGNHDTKGWELAPTEKHTVEYGGRLQMPLWTGEGGITYHHRRADLTSLLSPVIGTENVNVPEDRLGFDGKWDIGIGAWVEGNLIREETDIQELKYQRQWTLGADYTFALGSGLYVAMEYFEMENPREPFGPASGIGFSGLTANYPVGILDQVSGILYRDWRNDQWYRIVTWQRKYDNWSLYLLGFWDPENTQLYQNHSGTSAFAGTGFQFMIVFNH